MNPIHRLPGNHVCSIVIRSFADQATEDIFHARNTRTARSIPRQLWPVVRRKLDYLQAATRVDQLRYPPGNRLEALRGKRRGFFSVRVNEQYRLTFRFEQGHSSEVRCEDYH